MNSRHGVNAGKAAVADSIRQYGAAARSRMRPYFQSAAVDYPPAALVLVGLKAERQLEAWVKSRRRGGFALVRIYPILGKSGDLGPKLKEGDRQIPEGIYEVDLLNPNSRFHLSLRLNYPNSFDLMRAREDGRRHPGGDIMIHGDTRSAGCLAVGDQAVEDLFVLAADTGLKNIKVILAPMDLRMRELPRQGSDLPEWTGELYAQISAELAELLKEKQTAGKNG